MRQRPASPKPGPVDQQVANAIAISGTANNVLRVNGPAHYHTGRGLPARPAVIGGNKGFQEMISRARSRSTG